MYYQNMDLKSVVSPVKSERLVKQLKAANYDPLEIIFLENGFKQGFDIGYQGPKEPEPVQLKIFLSLWVTKLNFGTG